MVLGEVLRVLLLGKAPQDQENNKPRYRGKRQAPEKSVSAEQEQQQLKNDTMAWLEGQPLRSGRRSDERPNP